MKTIKFSISFQSITPMKSLYLPQSEGEMTSCQPYPQHSHSVESPVCVPWRHHHACRLQTGPSGGHQGRWRLSPGHPEIFWTLTFHSILLGGSIQLSSHIQLWKFDCRKQVLCGVQQANSWQELNSLVWKTIFFSGLLYSTKI